MKLMRPLAAAIALVLASASAHAQLTTPQNGVNPIANGDELVLVIYDSTGNKTELVNLGYNNALLTAPGNLSPTSATGAYSLVANPNGTGNVYQLNFGAVPQFGTTFTSVSSTTKYMVVENGASSTTPNIVATNLSQANMASMTQGAITTATNFISGTLGNWITDATYAGLGYAVDTTGSSAWGLGNNGTLPQLGIGFSFGGTVGSNLGFYEVANGAGATTNVTNFGPNGFWYLSSTGNLSYNVPVPLPAAVWLLFSGIAGLGALSRRRAA